MIPFQAVAGGAPVDVVLVELGAAITGLALLARLAARAGISPIPLYLLGGLAFGRGGLAPLDSADEVLRVGSEIGAGWWGARRETPDPSARWRAGLLLVPRGEFSIVIAGLASALPEVGRLAAAYVLITAIGGPVAIRVLSRRLS